MRLGSADFAGAWQLQRQIDDRYSKQRGDFLGSVDFRKDGENGLIYHEEGKIRFGDGPTFSATRSYHWQFEPEHVVVRFEDGSAFHTFVPTGRVAGSDHPCGDDFYRVSYDFTHWPAWRATWIVQGPRKDYTSISDYTR